MPPPPPPQTTRMALPLVYAAIGVVLGSFAGTTAAVVSLQPGMDSHFRHASLHDANFKIHSISNAGQAPVIQNHANKQAVPMIQAATPVAPNHANIESAPVDRPLPVESHENHTAAPAVAAAKPSPSRNQAASPAAHVVQPAVIVQNRTASPSARTTQLAAFETTPAKPTVPALPSAAVKVIAADAMTSNAPAVHKQLALVSLPTSKLAPSQSFDELPATPAPQAAPLGIESGLPAQAFYSEGDVMVAAYNAASDTIETDDGRIFVIGTTVSISTATTWDDYRSNVHYRCDQNGHCTLMRSGVIALNARLTM